MKLYIKYMVSFRCKMIVKAALEAQQIGYGAIELGEIEIKKELSFSQKDGLQKALFEAGLEIIEDKRAILIEKIKILVIELVRHEEIHIKVKNSEYISQKLNYDYTYLSTIFSLATGITIEHFIIIHKIERVKELLIYNELSLSEIAIKLNYSSVAHLSAQFKKTTGLTPSFFKNLKREKRICLEDM